MAIEFDPQEYIAALGSGNMSDPLSNISSIADFVANNNANYGPGLQNYSNYQNNMVMTDPTFTSGLNYARSIAGGQNVPNMIAPGVSYSAASPQGFTQMDLPPIVSGLPNIVTDSPPDDPAFLPGGDAVNPPDYTNLPPNIIGGGMGDNITILPPEDLRFPPPRDILGGYKPLDLTGIQSILDSFKPNFDDFVMKNDVPTYDDSDLRDLIAKNTMGINSVPDFDPSTLNLPDFSNFATKDDIPNINTNQFLTKNDLPVFNPQDFRDDFISIAREGIDIPQYEIPDVSQFITKDDLPVFEQPNLNDLYKRLDALENQPMIPNGSTFSVDQLPLGLFS